MLGARAWWTPLYRLAWLAACRRWQSGDPGRPGRLIVRPLRVRSQKLAAMLVGCKRNKCELAALVCCACCICGQPVVVGSLVVVVAAATLAQRGRSRAKLPVPRVQLQKEPQVAPPMLAVSRRRNTCSARNTNANANCKHNVLD